MADLDIRFYKAGDEDQIIELLKKTFPKWDQFSDPANLYRWKYLDTPQQKYITLTFHDDKLIACNHTLIFNVKIGSEQSTLSYTDDLVVDEAYRGKGLWRAMADYRNKMHPLAGKYTLSTTVNPVVMAWWKRDNRGTFPYPVIRLLKTKNIDHLLEKSTINKYLARLGYTVLKWVNRIQRIYISKVKPKSSFTIEQVNVFDTRVDIFWEQVKMNYHFILEKKHKYLNWRFTDNDRGSHSKFIAVENGALLGYVIVGYKDNESLGMVEDLQVIRDRLDIAESLFSYACSFLEGKGFDSVFYQVVKGHPFHKIASKFGFIQAPSVPFIMIDYSSSWLDHNKKEKILFAGSAPTQISFNYADTI